MTEETESFDADSGSRSAPGEVVDGRYRLECPVGGGVTATIWRAHDPILGRDVVVKVWTDDSAEARRSHQEELKTARLADPKLPELLDAGEHRGRPYLVSELQPRAGDAPDAPNSIDTATPPMGQVAVSRPRRSRVVIVTVVTTVIAVVLAGVGLFASPAARTQRGPASNHSHSAC